MRVFFVVMLLYPGEAVFEKVQETHVASFAECRAASRALRASYTPPRGFQYVTHCYDADTPDTPANGWLRENYDKHPRFKKSDDD